MSYLEKQFKFLKIGFGDFTNWKSWFCKNCIYFSDNSFRNRNCPNCSDKLLFNSWVTFINSVVLRVWDGLVVWLDPINLHMCQLGLGCRQQHDACYEHVHKLGHCDLVTRLAKTGTALTSLRFDLAWTQKDVMLSLLQVTSLAERQHLWPQYQGKRGFPWPKLDFIDLPSNYKHYGNSDRCISV